MVQYLQSHNLAAKEAQSKIKTPNKAFLSQWILDSKDREWTDTTRPIILKQLKTIGLETGDSSFLSTIESVLTNDDNWVWFSPLCYVRPSIYLEVQTTR